MLIGVCSSNSVNLTIAKNSFLFHLQLIGGQTWIIYVVPIKLGQGADRKTHETKFIYRTTSAICLVREEESSV